VSADRNIIAFSPYRILRAFQRLSLCLSKAHLSAFFVLFNNVIPARNNSDWR